MDPHPPRRSPPALFFFFFFSHPPFESTAEAPLGPLCRRGSLSLLGTLIAMSAPPGGHSRGLVLSRLVCLCQLLGMETG